MKQVLKINFTDFWGGFNKVDNLFVNLLSEHFVVEISECPTVLFFSCFGYEFLNYDCHKIYYTGENTRPKFTECDFALTFDYNWPSNKHYRMPLYRWRGDLENLTSPKDVDEIMQQKSKFCCMLISNPNGKERNTFFQKLSQYKKVDSGGGYMNNIGGRVGNKIEFIKQYKFVFAFENISNPGYTTEKIVEPMAVNSLPIYWGNKLIHREFNVKSFINIHDFPNFETAIEKIIEIDTNDDLFKKILNEPYYNKNIFPESLDFKNIAKALIDAIKSFDDKVPISTQNRLYNNLNMVRRKIYFKLTSKLI